MNYQQIGGGAVVFELGQAVRWPPAPAEVAQIVELRRSRVRVFYRCRTGLERQPTVAAQQLAALQECAEPVLPLFNLLGRGVARRRRKEFR